MADDGVRAVLGYPPDKLAIVLRLWALTNISTAIGLVANHWLADYELATAVGFIVHAIGLQVMIVRLRD